MAPYKLRILYFILEYLLLTFSPLGGQKKQLSRCKKFFCLCFFPFCRVLEEVMRILNNLGLDFFFTNKLSFQECMLKIILKKRKRQGYLIVISGIYRFFPFHGILCFAYLNTLHALYDAFVSLVHEPENCNLLVMYVCAFSCASLFSIYSYIVLKQQSFPPFLPN